VIHIKTVLYLILTLILLATICSARASPPPQDSDDASIPDFARSRAYTGGFFGIISLVALGIIVVSLIILCFQHFCRQYLYPRRRSSSY